MKHIVQVVYDDETGAITFEIPAADGGGDVAIERQTATAPVEERDRVKVIALADAEPIARTS